MQKCRLVEHCSNLQFSYRFSWLPQPGRPPARPTRRAEDVRIALQKKKKESKIKPEKTQTRRRINKGWTNKQGYEKSRYQIRIIQHLFARLLFWFNCKSTN